MRYFATDLDVKIIWRLSVVICKEYREFVSVFS